MSANNDPAAKKIGEEERARELQRRVEFDRLYAEWLLLLSRAWSGEDEHPEDDHQTVMERYHAAMQREDDLARLITTFPSVYSWMVLPKLEVLEHYLGADGGTAYTDNREVVMLAGIKADILRFLTEFEK